LAEGSTLATTSIALIPLILYAAKHTLILARHPSYVWFCYGLVAASILTSLGTFERTGLMALAALALCLWVRSTHKILYAALALVAMLIGLSTISGDWYARMTTISDFRVEDSALTRIAVWLWTLNYVAAHPFGGGFAAYLIDNFRVPIEGTGEFLEITARAFHSIYFEVLGEQGILGFGIFAALIYCLFAYLRSVRRASRSVPEDKWMYELASALTSSTLIYLVGGAFVGIAFQPILYYWFACSISLHQYVARAAGASAITEPAGNGRLVARRPVVLNHG
jgi:probable O-glycosylation ligase (exosortase A-associated)